MIKQEIDYNEPFYCDLNDRNLDNTKVIAQEWFLKPSYNPIRLSSVGGFTNNDFEYSRRSVVIIGTELQMHHKFTEMFKEYGWQIQSEYKVELDPVWKKHYENNFNKPLIINLI